MSQHQRSNEQVRRANLRGVLHALHYDGPHSRAALTKRTGFYRSTIAALVSELVQLDLASEALPEERTGVGRPSPIVAINPRIVALVAYPDVGAVVVGIVGLGGVVHVRQRRELSERPSAVEVVHEIAVAVERLRPELDAYDRVVGLGVAVPALVDVETGTVELAPNLKWTGEPLARLLEERLDIPVVLANDAQVGAAAERQFGPGRGVDHMIYVNGSGGGIGGGAYVDGHELRGYRGFGAEFGHIVIDPGGEACYCGQRGCFERVVRQSELLELIGRGSLDADELEQALVSNTDAALARAMDQQVDRLGDGIAVLVSALAPQLVVLGGFLSSLYRARPERLAARLAERSFGALSADVRVVSGGLGAHEVLVGISERVFERVFADPVVFGSATAA
ncbi:ROK family protein [Leucobacter sp. gxy201]|uniref:ROK family protein n=1 Tax=Leucobacter sp. gxy201 TaxID=2957200 RepID=UPI003D9FD778